jgi:hypothetical protein
MEITSTLRDNDKIRRLVLWFGVLTGPTAMLLHLQSIYSLVHHVCASGGYAAIRMVSVLLLLIVAASGIGAFLTLGQLRTVPSNVRTENSVMAERFMATLGIMTSALFVLVILAQAIPTFLVSPCQD